MSIDDDMIGHRKETEVVMEKYPELVALTNKDFVRTATQLIYRVHRNAVERGWWDEDRGAARNAELLALIHSEVSEALEALRIGNPLSEKTPSFSSVEEELADIVIRVMDMSAANGFDLAGAIVAKIHYNLSRPHKHDNKEF